MDKRDNIMADEEKQIINEKEKALDYVENIISSMRDASFKCKEFCILICSAFLTIFATVNPTPKMMVLMCAPILLIFWIIDSGYLSKERLFRKEYNNIVENKYLEQKKSPLLFKTRIGFRKGVWNVIKAMFTSFSTIMLYLPLITLSLVFGLLLIKGCI